MEAREQLYWLIAYLELPDRAVYWAAAKDAYRDTVVASSSLMTLGYLTTRPLWLLLYWIGGRIWIIATFLAKHLLSGVYVSTIKGFHQAKWIWNKYLYWQMSLSRRALLMEGSLVLTAAMLYLLRKYIQKKKYYERSVSWYKTKKRGVVKSYQSLLRKISHTSLLLAMLLPHVLYLGVVGSIKVLFPRVVTYIATETYLSSLLGTWYPLIWTISLLYHYRHGAPKSLTSKTKVAMKTPLKSASAQNVALHSPAKTPGIYPKTTPSKKYASTPVQRWLRAAATPTQLGDDTDMQEECTYWLHYWMVLAVLSTITSLLYSTPFMGRLMTRNVWIKSSLLEVQLLFFLWVFGLPASLTSASIDPTKGYESRPLPLLYTKVSPILSALYKVISNAVPEAIWNQICEKAKSFLSLCVMVKLLSEDSKDNWVHILVEARPLLPPAMTLFTPFTGVGVLYVKSIVPAAKHVVTCDTLSTKMASLEFWVLHTLLSGLLQWWSSVLWWIPFSSHVVFLLWCHVQIPKSCARYYNVLEEELQAFGLLDKGDKELEVQKSLTARLVTRWIQSLPSASASEDDIPSSHDRNNNTDEKENVSQAADSKELLQEENEVDDSERGEGDDDFVPTSVKVLPLQTRRSTRARK